MATVFGTSNNETLVGSQFNDLLLGNAGDDVLFAGAGDDLLLGGAGNDRLYGGDGEDQLFGEAGNDQLGGGNGNDFLSGGIGNDGLYGGAGDDQLFGDEGDDRLVGGAGNDELFGGAGNDVYFVDAGDTINEDTDNGIDVVFSSASWTLGDNLEHLRLWATTADINATGNALANIIVGNTGSNILDGRENIDFLYGGDGNDTLVGGADRDFLLGGAGADQFQFILDSSVSSFADLGVDQIRDFAVGEDKIVLDLDLFSNLASNATFAIIENGIGVDSTGASLVYNSTNGNLFYDTNGLVEGFGEGGVFASLSGVPTITASDFEVLSANSVVEIIDAVQFNEGFETGDFTNWDVIGTANVVTGDIGINPTDGNYQAMITNGSGSVSDAQIESFLGVNTGALDGLNNGNATEGSAIKLASFTVQAGDILSFDWNFITNESTPDNYYNDFAFVSIGSVSELADTNSNFTSISTNLGEQTGYGTFTYEFAAAGTYTIGMGVMDVNDTSVNSTLLVDNLVVV